MIHGFQLRGSRHPGWVRAARCILLAIGLALLGWAGFILIRAYLYQAYEGQAFDRALAGHETGHAQARLATVQPTLDSESRHPIISLPARGEPIARIEIPRVGLDTLVQRNHTETLRLGEDRSPAEGSGE